MAPAEEVDLGDALEELKSLLRIEDPCSPDAAPLDDKVLRRFLVARKGNAVKACEMYKAYLAYRRRTPHVQDEDVRVGLSHKKTFLVPGAVEDGTPCFLSIVNRHVVRDCPAGEAGMYAEYSFRRIANLLDREGYEQTVFIFDFQHFSWDNLDMRTAAATLKQGQDYHPERLKKAILFKAPTLFWTLWKLITPLMDAKTKSKFVFANNADELQRAGLVLARAPSTMGGGSHEEDWVPIERV